MTNVVTRLNVQPTRTLHLLLSMCLLMLQCTVGAQTSNCLKNVISDSELTMLISGVISFTLDGAKTQTALKIDRLVDNSFEQA